MAPSPEDSLFDSEEEIYHSDIEDFVGDIEERSNKDPFAQMEEDIYHSDIDDFVRDVENRPGSDPFDLNKPSTRQSGRTDLINIPTDQVSRVDPYDYYAHILGSSTQVTNNQKFKPMQPSYEIPTKKKDYGKSNNESRSRLSALALVEDSEAENEDYINLLKHRLIIPTEQKFKPMQPSYEIPTRKRDYIKPNNGSRLLAVGLGGNNEAENEDYTNLLKHRLIIPTEQKFKPMQPSYEIPTKKRDYIKPNNRELVALSTVDNNESENDDYASLLRHSLETPDEKKYTQPVYDVPPKKQKPARDKKVIKSGMLESVIVQDQPLETQLEVAVVGHQIDLEDIPQTMSKLLERSETPSTSSLARQTKSLLKEPSTI